jgi:hypothetical protein
MLKPVELIRYFNFWEETMIFLKCLSNGDLWCPSFVGKMMGFWRWLDGFIEKCRMRKLEERIWLSLGRISVIAFFI